MTRPPRKYDTSRRTILRSTAAGTAGLALVGNAAADCDHDDGNGNGDDDGDTSERYGGTDLECGYGWENVPEGVGHVYPQHHDACAGDHPESQEIQEACKYTVEYLYPEPGALIAQGYLPYFDVAIPGGFSHWLHPEWIDNGVMLDPGRPECLLVDNDTWCSMGVMFIPDAARADSEPPVYVESDPEQYDHDFGGHDHGGDDDHDDHGDDDHGHGDGHGGHGDGHGNGGHDDPYHEFRGCNDSYYASEDQGYYYTWSEDDGTTGDGCVTCAPWHRHTDLPARFSWWYYRQAHDGALAQDQEVMFWCVTPAMLHVWPHASEDEVYQHGAPEDRGTEERGPCHPEPFVLDADPSGGELTMDQLPQAVQERSMPEGLRAELDAVEQLGTDVHQMPLGEVTEFVHAETGTVDRSVEELADLDASERLSSWF